MLQESQIKDFLLSNGINYAEHATIFGTAKPSIGNYGNGISKVMNANMEHVLHFNKEGLVIIGINELNADIIPSQLVFIPLNEIQRIRFKMGLLFCTMKIETKNGEMKYKIRNIMPGYPWHKENLSFLLLRGTESQ